MTSHPAGEPENLRAVAVRGAFWLGLVSALAKGAQLVVMLAYAHFLTPGELGQLSLTTAILNLAGLIQTMGFFDVVARTRRDPQRLSGTLVTFATVLASVVTLIGFVAAPSLATWLNAPGAADLFRAAALCLPFMAYNGVQVALIAREMRFRSRVVGDGGSAILGALVSIGLTALGWGVRGALTGVIVAAVSAPVLLWFVGVRIAPRWSMADLRETLSWAWIAGPGALLGVALLNVDYVVTTRILGDVATGLYSLAYRIVILPYMTVAIVIGAVSFPIFAKLAREDRWEDFRATVSEFLSISALLIVGIYAMVYAAAHQLVLLGDKWGPSVPTLRIMCLYGAFLSLNITALDAIRAAGGKVLFFWIQAAHLAMLVGLLIVLTSADGITGTAWAQSVAATTVFVGASLGLCRASGTPVRVLARAVVAPLVAGLVVILVASGPWWPQTVSLVVAIAQVALAGGLFVAVAAVLDRRLVRAAVSLVRRRLTRAAAVPETSEAGTAAAGTGESGTEAGQ